MGEYDIDKELYLKWFADKTITIEQMKTKDEINQRIKEIYYIEFYCKREWAMLNQQYDKIAGRKGIPPHIKEDRDRLITDPNIQVNWDGEPRKKQEKKPKQDLIKDLFGQSVKEMRQKLKEDNGGFVAPEIPTKKQTLNEALDSMMLKSVPKEEKPKLSAEEIKAKAEAIKEKMRKAKEEREQKALEELLRIEQEKKENEG